jgi:hypothetical protein
VSRKPRKCWTAADTEKLCEFQAKNLTDGPIAKVLDVTRITVWRRRVALGLDRAEHPLRRGRLEARVVRVGYTHAAALRRQHRSD